MAHALRQRRAGLLALFDSVGALDVEGTTAHTIALRRQPGAAGVTVPIAQLTAFLRSARLVGGGAMELDEWMLRPLTEVEFLELLMHVRSGAGDEEAAMRQSLQVLNARGVSCMKLLQQLLFDKNRLLEALEIKQRDTFPFMLQRFRDLEEILLDV